MDSLAGVKEPHSVIAPEALPPKALGRREVAAGYGWNALFSFLGKAIFPILQIFFYRKLGPAEIGIYAVLIPIYMICDSLRDAGLALTYIADREHADRREGEYATLAMVNAALFAAAIFLAKGYISAMFRLPQLNLGLTMVALAMLLTGVSAIPANKLQKQARFKEAGLVDFFSTLASFVVAFGMVFLNFGYLALVGQFVAKSLFFALACWAIAPVRPGWVHRGVVQSIWRRSSHNLLNNLLFTVYTVADNLLVAKVFGRVAVGNYNAAYTFGMKPVEFFTVPLGKTLLIAYTRKADDLRALANVFSRTIAAAILAMAPLYAIVGVFAKPIVMLLLGVKYAEAVPLLAVLSIYCACRSVGSLCGNVLVSMNKPVYNVYGWVLAYLAVGAILWMNWRHLALITVVEALTVGAATVYLTNTVAAFAVLKPGREDRLKLYRALSLSAAAAAIAALLSFLPFDARWNLAVACVAVPLVHAIGVGCVYARSVCAGFSKKGLKAIWHAI